jgi:hypothetical protein
MRLRSIHGSSCKVSATRSFPNSTTSVFSTFDICSYRVTVSGQDSQIFRWLWYQSMERQSLYRYQDTGSKRKCECAKQACLINHECLLLKILWLRSERGTRSNNTYNYLSLGSRYLKTRPRASILSESMLGASLLATDKIFWLLIIGRRTAQVTEDRTRLVGRLR